MERIAMSQEERDRLDWLKRARDGKMTQREALMFLVAYGRTRRMHAVPEGDLEAFAVNGWLILSKEATTHYPPSGLPGASNDHPPASPVPGTV